MCYNTLIHSAAGGRSQTEANAAKSWLTKETAVVITYIAELGNCGFPLSHQRLKEHVDDVLRTHLGDQFPASRVGNGGPSTSSRSIQNVLGYLPQVKTWPGSQSPHH